MKNVIRIMGFIILIVCSNSFKSCKKEELPTITTSALSNLTVSRVSSGGDITNEGSATVTARGVCWSTSINPTIADNTTNDGAGVGSFTSRIIGLKGGTTYYIRAYATNTVGTGYGMTISGTTQTSNIPTNGLVGYYPFDGNPNDYSYNGNNGTVNGATLTTDRFGEANCAYFFDGVSNTITGTTNNWPLSNSSRTISLWIKLRSLPDNGENKLFLTYGPEIEHCLTNLYFQYTQVNGKRVVFGGYFDDINVSFDYSVDTWYNVVGIFDGTIAKLYINGELIAQENKSTWNTVSSDFHIGGWYNAIAFLNGTIDDIRIYNRFLNPNEVLLLYNEIP